MIPTLNLTGALAKVHLYTAHGCTAAAQPYRGVAACTVTELSRDTDSHVLGSRARRNGGRMRPSGERALIMSEAGVHELERPSC